MRPILWATVGMLGISAVYGQSPGEVVVIREPGRPERRCLVEHAPPAYIVRDVATGARWRVADVEPSRSRGPRLVRVIAPVDAADDSSMTRALAGSPAAVVRRRAPTNAELAAPSTDGAVSPAGGFKRITSLPTRPTTSPVRTVLLELQHSADPVRRARAAATLVLSDARTMPEVVKALMRTARDDADPSVRLCGVRCLYRLAAEVPDVVPVLVALADDPTQEIAHTARLALREIEDPALADRLADRR